jgi:sugar (pentulose or hexulose) kinase
VSAALASAMGELARRAGPACELRALAVDGTSGTVVGVDAAGRATTPALMYDDGCAAQEAPELEALRSSGAPVSATSVFLHQADFVAARLTGEVGLTDSSNALKTGYDLSAEGWARWIDGLPGLRAKLPRVVEPGARLGAVRDAVAAALGLPGGVWLPGAASNVGGGWIRAGFAGADLGQLDARALALLPSESLAYPLHSRGERFPFWCDSAEAFCEPAARSDVGRYAANLQGTALVERLAYEVLDIATGPGGERGPVFATGGGARSDVWMQLRADVCGRTYHRRVSSESAFGSAVLAAGEALFDDLWQASRAMVRLERSFHPDPRRRALYDEYHARFRAELERRGYLQGSP